MKSFMLGVLVVVLWMPFASAQLKIHDFYHIKGFGDVSFLNIDYGAPDEHFVSVRYGVDDSLSQSALFELRRSPWASAIVRLDMDPSYTGDLFYRLVVRDINDELVLETPIKKSTLGDLALGDSLISYWRFDHSTADLLGRHHGILKGGELSRRYVESPLGTGLWFDGIDQRVEMVDRDSGAFDTQAISFSFWLKPDSQTGSVLFKSDLNSWVLDYLADTRTLRFGTDRLPERFTEATLDDGKWSQVVVTSSFLSGMARLFVNGELRDEAKKPNQDQAAAPLAIGGRPDKPLETFRGGLDDLAIWGRALSEEDIERIWNGGSARAIESLLTDDDKDEIPDIWEERYFGIGIGDDYSRSGSPHHDPDEDGLSDFEEYVIGTDPTKGDTDNDGVSDLVEVQDGITNPVAPDSDSDGGSDGEELLFGLDPINWDSDGDGFADGDELKVSPEVALDPNQRPDVRRELIGYWEFDGDTVDGVGGLRPEWMGDSPLSFSEESISGKAISFDGNGFLEFDAETSERFAFEGKAFSVSIWFRARVVKPSPWYAGIISSNQGGSHWHFYETDGAGLPGYGFFVPGRNSSLLRAEPSSDLQWHHFVVIYDRDRFYEGKSRVVQAFIDGAERYFSDDWRVGSGPKGDDLSQGMRIGELTGTRSGVNSKWIGEFDDLAMWGRVLSANEVGLVYDAGKNGRPLADVLAPDEDGDGMSDWWESMNGLDLDRHDALEDRDSDGLTNLREFQLGTLPLNVDTDDDGLSDGVESLTGQYLSVSSTGTDPRNDDSDNDGLPDGIEIFGDVPSDPNRLDTDNDEHPDPVELRYGSDPSQARSVPTLVDGLALELLFDGNLDVHASDAKLLTVGMRKPVYDVGVRGSALRLNGDGQSLLVLGWSPGTEALGYTISAWYRQETHPMDIVDATPREFSYFLGPTLMTFGEWRLRESRAFSFRSERWRIGMGWTAQLGLLEKTVERETTLSARFDHAVGVVDHVTNTSRFFVNGEELREGLPRFRAVESGDSTLVIGTDPEWSPDLSEVGNRDWAGLIDEFKIWDRPLTARDVAELYGTNRPAPVDTDSDGQSDEAEWVAGTDPNDPVSVLRISDVVRSGNEWTVKWSSILGRSYVLERSASLLQDDWSEFGRVSGSGSEVEVSSIVSEERQFYFRIRVVQE